MRIEDEDEDDDEAKVQHPNGPANGWMDGWMNVFEQHKWNRYLNLSSLRRAQVHHRTATISNQLSAEKTTRIKLE